MATVLPSADDPSSLFEAEGAPAESAPLDPHRSKIPPDDPRLRLGRVRGRTLKRGPAIALVLGLSGVILISLVVALEPNSSSSGKKNGQAEAISATKPVVPDSIRFASDKPLVSGPPLHFSGADGGAPSELGLEPLGRRGAGRSDATDPRDPYSPERRKQLDEEEAWKARGSSVLFNVGASTQAGSASTLGAGMSPAPQPFHAPAEPAKAPNGQGGGADDPNSQERKNAFIDQLGAAKTKRSLEARIEKPLSPYEVKAGSIIPAVLLTAINSDLPGPVVGQVRENVYDTITGNYLLIPQGSRLLAAYDSMVAWGQERVLCCWNRLIFPNGDSLNLECMPAADLEGAAGLSDEVNEHWGRLLKGAAISTLLAATSQAVAGNTDGFNPTVPQMWARSAGNEVNQIGQRLTARSLNIQPTITVRAGYSVNVMVTKDLIVPPYRSAAARSTIPTGHP
jgi:type IV secretory pathway VirB10-like protein